MPSQRFGVAAENPEERAFRATTVAQNHAKLQRVPRKRKSGGTAPKGVPIAHSFFYEIFFTFQMPILLLNCGGTIDKSYNPTKEIFEHTKTHLPQIIAECRIFDTKLETKELFLKDSLDMTTEDFELLVKECEKSVHQKIIVMHGTSKMTKSAQLLAAKNLKKTVVFFGAMLPFELQVSDAKFDFGLAMAAVQTLPHGVYIAMNGKIFPHDCVLKDENNAIFTLSPKKR